MRTRSSRREKRREATPPKFHESWDNLAKEQSPILLPDKVSPHVFRHTKAMHLLQANVNLVYIRDFLGHASVTTSEIYARADARMKRLALEQAYSPTVIDDVPAWQDNQDLLSWLQKICR